MKKPWIASCLAAGCGLVLPLALAQSDTPPPLPPGYQQGVEKRIQYDAPSTPSPGEQRDVEKRLEMRRSADREGQQDEAGRIREERRQGDGRRGPDARLGNEGRREGAPAMQQTEVRELRRNRAQLTEKLEQLRNQGAEEDAANVKQRIADIDRRMAQMAEARGRRPEPNRPRPAQQGQPGPGPGGPEAERRLQHLTVAIDNLHAAGMHEPAERLARERDEIARQMQNGPGNAQDRPELVGEIRRLRAELDEVRQALRGLKARVEELHGGGR